MMKNAGGIFSWMMIGVSVFGILGLAACRATVAGDPNRPIKIEAHITVDVRQVKEAATSIEDMVSGTRPQTVQKPVSFLWNGMISAAWAEAPQLKVMTPEVQKAVDSRRGRFDQLKGAKAKGSVGEDNQGHVAALSGGPEIHSLVEAENQDREAIYRAIVDQNQLPADAMSTIRATFAEVEREKAEPGEKIQLPSGEWTAK